MVRPRFSLSYLLLTLACGCAGQHAPAQRVMLEAVNAAQPAVVAPHVYHVVWSPGDYTSFVVVSSTDIAVPLLQWPVWLETDETNFPFTPDEAQRFFTLYGTNKVTGESAWAGT
jgi:hypothetical protein